jgi:hypothetical protein
MQDLLTILKQRLTMGTSDLIQQSQKPNLLQIEDNLILNIFQHRTKLANMRSALKFFLNKTLDICVLLQKRICL